MGQVLKGLTNVMGSIKQQSTRQSVSPEEVPKNPEESQPVDQHLPLEKPQPFVRKTHGSKRKASSFRVN